MRTTRFISLILAILSISLWIALGLYFALTNHWGIFAIVPLLIPLLILTLIADAMCIVELVKGIKKRYFDWMVAVFVVITSSILFLAISR